MVTVAWSLNLPPGWKAVDGNCRTSQRYLSISRADHSDAGFDAVEDAYIEADAPDLEGLFVSSEEEMAMADA